MEHEYVGSMVQMTKRKIMQKWKLDKFVVFYKNVK